MMRKSFKILFLFFICISLMAAAYKTEQDKRTKGETSITIDQWLIAGPVSLPLPVVTGEGDEFPVKNLFDLDVIDPQRLWIKEGEEMEWTHKKNLKWKTQKARRGMLSLPAGDQVPQVAFLVCYLDSSRWQKTQIEIESNHLLKVFLDGAPVVTKSSSLKSDAKEVGKVTGHMALFQGKHRLFITAIRDPKGNPDWSIKTSLRPEKKEYLEVNLTARRCLTEDDIFNSLRLSNILISPDGKAVCYTVSQRDPKTGRADRWIEIRKLPGGEIERAMRDSRTLRNLIWSPDGKFLSALVPGEKGTSDLWLIERETGETCILLNDINGLRSAVWSPTGDFIVYTVREEPEDKDPKIQRLTKMEDRYPYSPYKTHLYMVMVDSKICRRLTAGSFSARTSYIPGGGPISPDGNRIVFVKNEIDLKNRPFNKQEFIVLDLEKNTTKSIFTSHFWYESSSWSPDGKYIYFVGSQSAGNPGLNNEEENDLYTLDPDSGELKCLTDKFDPSVSAAFWRGKGSIFLLVQDKSRVQLYKTDVTGKHFQKLGTGVDVVRGLDVSTDGKTIVFSGESIQAPAKLFVMDVKGESPRLVYAPEEERWSDVIYGKVEDFNFKNSRGDSIEGFIYYPVDFDPKKKYPLIVYYYGGVFPTSRNFNTRFLQYASNGYFVYVLNPSGAIGYGRKFANLHVNDWGKIVTQEIIQGVKKVIKSKPFIDSKKIGAFGGSYGGFMTLALGYKTNLFKTIIANYAVTNITSHWGAGYWGYSYCAHSAANSYPWNRRDIYVDRSPIFHADKINAAVLLLHGDADVNVRYGESEQMYTALKVLQKEVELIRFKDEDHGIRGTDENRRAVPQIMMAWWDKYLKDQPEAWENLWKK